MLIARCWNMVRQLRKCRQKYRLNVAQTKGLEIITINWNSIQQTGISWHLFHIFILYTNSSTTTGDVVFSHLPFVTPMLFLWYHLNWRDLHHYSCNDIVHDANSCLCLLRELQSSTLYCCSFPMYPGWGMSMLQDKHNRHHLDWLPRVWSSCIVLRITTFESCQ